MVEGKYDKYVIREPWCPTIYKHDPLVRKMTAMILMDKHLLKEATHHIEVFTVYGAGAGFGLGGEEEGSLSGQIVKHKPQKHPFDEIFCYVGTDPHNTNDLGGEIEMWLGEGEEAEKYIINTPSCVFVPKGTIHHPTYFRRVDRPIVVIVIATAPEWRGSFIDTFPPGFSMTNK